MAILVVESLEVVCLPQHPSNENFDFKERCVKLKIETSSLPGAEVCNDVISLSLKVCEALAGIIEEVTGECSRTSWVGGGGHGARGREARWKAVGRGHVLGLPLGHGAIDAVLPLDVEKVSALGEVDGGADGAGPGVVLLLPLAETDGGVLVPVE